MNIILVQKLEVQFLILIKTLHFDLTLKLLVSSSSELLRLEDSMIGKRGMTDFWISLPCAPLHHSYTRPSLVGGEDLVGVKIREGGEKGPTYSHTSVTAFTLKVWQILELTLIGCFSALSRESQCCNSSDRSLFQLAPNYSLLNP